MKVVQIVTHMEAGGAQSVAMRVAGALRVSHSVETWFIYRKTDAYLNEPHVRVIYHRQPRSPIDAVVIVIRLVRLLRRVRADAVLSYTHYAATLGQSAAWLARVRCRVATMQSPSWSYPRAARVANRLLGSLGIYTKIVAVSKSVRETFASYPEAFVKRMKVIYNGVFLSQSELSKSAARSQFGLPADVHLLANVGRLHPAKNQILLVDMLRRLPDCHLAIAGAGELRTELLERAAAAGVSERVHFLGELAPARISDFLRTADLFVFPSQFEAFGLALFEAALAGLPIIASDIDSSREVLGALEGEPAAVLLPANDVAAWVDAVRRFQREPALCQILVERARARADIYSLDAMVAQYEECLVHPSAASQAIYATRYRVSR